MEGESIGPPLWPWLSEEELIHLQDHIWGGGGGGGRDGGQEGGHQRLLVECQGRERSSLRYSHLENMLSKAFGIFLSKVLLFALGDRWKE